MSSPSAPTRPLRHGVVETIVRRIVGGELAPGTFLPSEPELSLQLSVSRTVVREALHVLESKGLVEVRHGARTCVLPAERWDPLDATVLVARRERGAMLGVLQDLLEARRIFEVEVAALAAERCNESHLRAMDAAIESMSGSLDEPTGFMRGDAAFHRALLAATDNAVLMRMMEPMETLMHFGQQITDALEGVLERALGEHVAIYRAVRRRDAEAARRAMRRHLAHAERDIRSFVRVS